MPCFYFPVVSSLVKKVSYGEVIERDRTVSVGCFFDGNGLTSCGWWFKPTVSKDPLTADVVYSPRISSSPLR